MISKWKVVALPPDAIPPLARDSGSNAEKKDVKEEDHPSFKLLTAGQMIDVKDRFEQWCVAQIVLVRPTHIFVTFPEWLNSDYDLWMPRDSPRIAPLHSHSTPRLVQQYTGLQHLTRTRTCIDHSKPPAVVSPGMICEIPVRVQTAVLELDIHNTLVAAIGYYLRVGTSGSAWCGDPSALRWIRKSLYKYGVRHGFWLHSEANLSELLHPRSTLSATMLPALSAMLQCEITCVDTARSGKMYTFGKGKQLNTRIWLLLHRGKFYPIEAADDKKGKDNGNQEVQRFFAPNDGLMAGKVAQLVRQLEKDDSCNVLHQLSCNSFEALSPALFDDSKRQPQDKTTDKDTPIKITQQLESQVALLESQLKAVVELWLRESYVSRSRRMTAIQRGDSSQVLGALCHVCMERPVDTLLMPCRHVTFCENCVNKLNNCPLCRVKIVERVRVFTG